MSPIIKLADDDENGVIEHLSFCSRPLHRLLGAAQDDTRPVIVRDALKIGAEVLAHANEHGDLSNLSQAVERLDDESKRIVQATTARFDAVMEKSIGNFATSLNGADGPLSDLLRRLDPAEEHNVMEAVRDAVLKASRVAAKEAVGELTEAITDNVARLTKSMNVLEKVAAVEQARMAEAEKGTQKGIDHEADVEALLGELVGAVGDSLDDVSTVIGVMGTKKGDKTITPRGGRVIVTEDKCTAAMSESKARKILQEAMDNRAADLGMLIVEDESKVPGKQPFHFIDDDKVVVVADRWALRLVYAFMRVRSIEIATTIASIDDADLLSTVRTVHELAREIRRSLDQFKLIRTEHTKASNAITQASGYVDAMATAITTSVTQILVEIDELVARDDERGAA